jgi:hypothetical protein
VKYQASPEWKAKQVEYEASPEVKAKRVEYHTSPLGRNNYLKRTYGITLEDFNEMLEMQAGLCAICCEPMKPGKGTHVEHDHTTKRVRGLTCAYCNLAVGFAEKEGLMRDVSIYLEINA